MFHSLTWRVPVEQPKLHLSVDTREMAIPK